MAQSMKAADSGRVSVVSIFRGYSDRPQTIFVPPVYQEQLSFLYAGFDFGHTFVAGSAPLPADKTTTGKLDLYEAVSVARITFFDLGADFVDCLGEFDRQAGVAGTLVYQVFLPLDQPCTGQAVDLLRRQGYFLGSILPRWYGDDGLLMQKLSQPSNIGNMKIFSDRTRQILAMIEADRMSLANR